MSKDKKNKSLDKLSAADQKLEKRIEFIDLCADSLGFVGTQLIMRRFDVQRVMASRDIQEYLRRTGDTLKYVHQLNGYVPQENFTPLLKHPTKSAIELIGEGAQYVECLPRDVERMEVVNVTTALPEFDAVKAVFRALFRSHKVRATYLSASTGKGQRTLSPHSLIWANGFYYVRAYDHGKSSFLTFKLNRFQKSQFLSEKSDGTSLSDNDTDWQTTIEIHARLNPLVQNPETYSLDYGLVEGVKVLKTKKALSRLVMTAWQIAPADFDNLPPEFFPLVFDKEVSVQ